MDAPQVIRSEETAVAYRPEVTSAIVRAPAVLRYNLLKPGRTIIPGGGIFITVLKPTDRAGDVLNRELAFIGGPENLLGGPHIFGWNAAATGDLTDWHGYNGWKSYRRRFGFFDPRRLIPSSYETERFRGYQDGSAIRKWGIPELELVNGRNRNGEMVCPTENMLEFNRDENSAFHNTFAGMNGSEAARRLQTLTAHPSHPSVVQTIDTTNGLVHWDDGNCESHRSCIRPVMALELNQVRDFAS